MKSSSPSANNPPSDSIYDQDTPQAQGRQWSAATHDYHARAALILAILSGQLTAQSAARLTGAAYATVRGWLADWRHGKGLAYKAYHAANNAAQHAANSVNGSVNGSSTTSNTSNKSARAEDVSEGGKFAKSEKMLLLPLYKTLITKAKRAESGRDAASYLQAISGVSDLLRRAMQIDNTLTKVAKGGDRASYPLLVFGSAPLAPAPAPAPTQEPCKLHEAHEAHEARGKVKVKVIDVIDVDDVEQVEPVPRPHPHGGHKGHKGSCPPSLQKAMQGMPAYLQGL